MLTTERTVEELSSTCTGAAMPSSMGPTFCPPPSSRSSPKAMCAASSVGMTRRLASPRSVASWKAFSRTSSSKAASALISPSISRSGASARAWASASRIFSELSVSKEP